MTPPLAIDLYCGMGGWTEGLLAAGFRVIGFDLEHWPEYPGQLVIQDVLTLHGSQLKDATLIVGSSPCNEFSYRAMPWKRAKALPPPYKGIELFQAQFRIQREASEAVGHHVPMVAENVCGAQKWVGRAKWHYGSYYLWGDVPALMPWTAGRLKFPAPCGPCLWSERDVVRLDDGRHQAFHQTTKNTSGSRFAIANNKASGHSRNPVAHEEYRKGSGGGWFSDLRSDGTRPNYRETGCVTRLFNSKSVQRKEASAQIAMIPFPLARWIGECYREA